MTAKNTQAYIDDKKKQGLHDVDFLGAVHPGATLQEELNVFGITQKDFANKIGYSHQTVNRIIKEREPITTDIALALERAFDGTPSAQFWLNMQASFDREESKARELEESKAEIEFFKSDVKETYKELQRGGVFEKYILNTVESYKQSIIEIKDFFGSHSLQTIPSESLLGVAFRKKYTKKLNQYNLAALLKIGERKARRILKENRMVVYKRDVFVRNLSELRKLSNKPQKEFLELLQRRCLDVGVVLVYVPNMSKTYFGGATLWIADRPVILLKVENQWEDIFWFNFYHEAGHIVKHGKKKVFVDFDDDGNKNKEEIEADEFASKNLIPDFEAIAESVGKTTSRDKWFDTMSAKTGVSKSVVAGRLCNIIKAENVWKNLNEYRPTIKEKVAFV